VLSTVNYFVDESFRSFEELVNKEATFEDKIENIILMKKTYANEMSQDFIMRFMEIYAEDSSNIKNLYHTKGSELYQKLFQQGRAEGKISNSISDKALYLYMDMYSDYLSKEEVSSQIKPLAQEFMRLFMYGISGK
jgi:hypothetical protein